MTRALTPDELELVDLLMIRFDWHQQAHKRYHDLCQERTRNHRWIDNHLTVVEVAATYVGATAVLFLGGFALTRQWAATAISFVIFAIASVAAATAIGRDDRLGQLDNKIWIARRALNKMEGK